MFLSSLFAWPRLLSWMRVVYAALVIIRFRSFLPFDTQPYLYTILGAFLLYAVILAVRSQRPKNDAFGLLALFGDVILFLIVAWYGASTLRWLPALLYLHLVVEAMVFYGAVELFVVVGACLLVCLSLNHSTRQLLAPGVLITGSLACASALRKEQLNRQIHELKAQVEEARREKEKAIEDERQRIASDFHDGPLQSFIALQMRLEVLRKLLELDFQRGMDDLKKFQVLAQSQVRDLRAFLHSMRPVDVDGANLMASALRTDVKLHFVSWIPVTFLGANTPVGLPPEMGREVLQLLREALHNIQKHSGATRVAVALEKIDRNLEISVDDNGRGFNFAGNYSLEELELLQLGPASLKRRARSLNADLLVESRPGRGTGLKVRVPLS